MSEAINRLGDAKNFVSLGYTHSALMAIDDAIKILKAAQAQAVNQQLLEALQPLRFDVLADHYEEDRLWYEPCEDGSLLYYDQVVAALAAAHGQ